MNSGTFLTRLSIWLALCGYTIAAGILLSAPCRPFRLAYARRAWTFGCAFFLAHVIYAFASYHHWSHAAAYRETARQTAALTGWDWGGGIFINYLFGLAWLTDVS